MAATLRRSDAARRRVRRYLIARDGLACARCGELITDRPSIGHRIAIARGGSDHESNLALEHLSCNVLGGAALFSPAQESRQVSAAQDGPKPPTSRRIGVMPPDA